MNSPAPRRFGKCLAWAVALAALTLGTNFILRELESSELQARYLSSLSKELTYRLEPGVSDLPAGVWPAEFEGLISSADQ